MLRFTGTLTKSYKDLVCVALLGEPKPIWLRVSHIRSNSNGHTIRIQGKVMSPESQRIARILASHEGKNIPCADGLVYLTSYSTLM